MLICAAVRSFIWYRFDGIGHWIVHSIQFVTGVILCLLSLLNIGGAKVDVLNSDDITPNSAPIYRLLAKHAPLVIVACAFVGMYIGTALVLEILHHTRGGIYEDRIKTGKSESSAGEEINGRGGTSPPNVAEEYGSENHAGEKGAERQGVVSPL